MFPSIIKRLDITTTEYLHDLVDSGRKYVFYEPNTTREQVLSECERHEFAGHLLKDADKCDDIGSVISEIMELGDFELPVLMANYCITNSPANANTLLDQILNKVVRYFADDMQALLDKEIDYRYHAEQIENGMKLKQCQQTGELIWSK